ncbi:MULTISPECIES: molybdopterin dinucleotide binding domain-containing protein [unclassified Halomonas]|uniref:molybdopterin dinucleotide binding domain-containing protein n=1 Tax=unclassified Halomonas TaxID=2609666 RepID=UPI0028839666|nr:MULTISPECIES: molybdopterin dinucleotide binding domain-containing protein [unclassified Halomonas]MDT0501400.1 molybdopterin dinucleotide binding domain-containing protein [Halomonas sp. PAR7]MDT0512926.1 molybdopterin dinucleotide binding domain-containing protein [Halomonas sp. LES1]MDT0591249.1 molybdopterin dinucleotide binding domain-containing protein [Halomonas sp. PAR8]
MDKSRRRLLKGAVAAGGAATFAAGYSGPLVKMAKGVTGSAGEKPDHHIYGNALAPEYRVDLESGELTLNPDQRTAFTVCYGCTTKCGVRVRIDNESDEVLRTIGNPYHPLSSDPHLPMRTPVVDALKSVSAYQEQGLAGRSTACARGNAMIAQMTSPHRVTDCLKRVGGRGERRWERISFERLIEEVCEGGDLFGEGHVDGLRAIHNHDELIDPDNPEYGPKANQLLMMEATDYGRSALLKRFAFNAFGTRNYGHHGSYCGLAFRMGSGALMGDLAKNAHVKPDYTNARFALFIGTAPSQAGNPFKRQGRLLAEARSTGSLDYIVIDPGLNAAASHAAGERSRWVPIRPASDTAFAMAMIQWLIEHEAYAADYLAIPSPQAAEAANENGHTNATHLVIETDGHPRRGHFLRLSDLGRAEADSDADDLVVVDADGELKPSAEVRRATLFVERDIEGPDGTLRVKSSLTKLRDAANEYSLEEYADHCGIDARLIQRIAERFAAYGRDAVVDTHGGMMNATGFYGAYGIMMLNLLAGSFNRQGGAALGGGKFNGTGSGPRYDLSDFPGKRGPKGVFVSRSRFAYENTSEYKRKVAAGENPYPAKAPWRSLAPPILTEQLSSALDGYPYRIKAVIGCMANPLYGQAGLESTIGEKLKDPRNLGLYVAIDGFINETSRYADYIVPDSVMYEVWGFTGAWSGTLTRMTTACWPIVEPRQQKTAEGEPVSMESFFIAAAKRLELPGFGDEAIPDAEGRLHPLNRAEDFFLRAAANIAYQGEPLPAASDSDIRHGGIEPLLGKLERTLPENERGPVAYLYARGGRFEEYSAAYKGDKKLGHAWSRPLCVYNPKVGTAFNSQTGERLAGTPRFQKAEMSDGRLMREVYPEEEWPLLAFSYKSNIMNSYAIGLERLRMIKPYNPVLLHSEDAARHGIQHGDTVRIESPGGALTALALVSDGVMKGALGIEHSYGHTELGASQHLIDGEAFSGNEWVGAGVNINDLGFADPTREVTGTWLEGVSGASVRQGLPIRVSRIEA